MSTQLFAFMIFATASATGTLRVCETHAAMHNLTEAIEAATTRRLTLAAGQQFYITRCVRPDKPCPYADHESYTSECHTVLATTTALAKPYDEPQQQWRLRQIQVESGCACRLQKRRDSASSTYFSADRKV